MVPLFLSSRLMLAAMVILILIAITNYCALFFCCFATDYYGMWLQTYYPKDLACLRILVGYSMCMDRYHTLLLTISNGFGTCSSSPLNNVICIYGCWCVQVQNGLALYTTWTSIASLINFSLVLHLWGVVRSTAASASLCILFAELMGW